MKISSKIYNEDEVWVAADCSKKEINDFLDSMNSNQFKEVENGTVEFYSLTLILAGAIGNLGERGWNLVFNDNGKVTDFVELLFIPSFNLADTYISFGIVLLLYSEIKNK